MTHEDILTIDAEPSYKNREDQVEGWLYRFERLLAERDISAVMETFAEDPWWRDFHVLTWDVTARHGREAVGSLLSDVLNRGVVIRNVQLDRNVEILVEPSGAVRAFWTFETDISIGRGVIRLVEENDALRAWTISSELRGLRDHQVAPVSIKDAGQEKYNTPKTPEVRGRNDLGVNSSDRTDPEVLVVGAGHSGLILAARLGELGIDTLVVDKHGRAGDSWRRRYSGLSLHDPKFYSQLPYMPFPPTWPLFSAKDDFADWLEAFVRFMKIDLWTSSPVLTAEYEPETESWNVVVDHDGVRRTMRPKHLVLATGLNGNPVIPQVAGSESFQGVIAHSSTYQGGAQVAGKRVIVVGTGSSGMDVAQNAYESGASHVTLMQRGSTYVMSTRHGVPRQWGANYSESSPPNDIADSLNNSLPLAYMIRNVAPLAVREIAEKDSEMLAGLADAGFHTTLGPGDAGILYKTFVNFGGYYIDKGAAQLIIDRKFPVRRDGIASFTPSGVIYGDGTEDAADIVVFATGFQNMRESFRPILGDDVTDSIATVWGLDETGEVRTTFRHTGHPRLWVFAGGVGPCRFHSRQVATMIQAVSEGLLDADISVRLKPTEYQRTEF